MANLPTQNNNPGDLRNVGQVGATQGAGGFASFPDAKTGYAALLNDIQTKINNNPQATLVDFASKYAPASDGNNVGQYAANLANQLGVAPNATIGSLQPKIGQFAEAIAKNEGYQGQIQPIQGQQYNAIANGGNPTLAQGYQAPVPPGNSSPTLPSANGYEPPTPPTSTIAPQQQTSPQGGIAQGIYPGQNGANPQGNPMDAATNITNALGLKGTTDTFGSDIAHVGNPDVPLPSLEQNAGALLQTGAIAATPFIGPEAGPLANIATGAALGAAQTGGQAMTQNASAPQVAQKATLGGLLGGGVSATTYGLGTLLGSLGDKISFGVIKPGQADIRDGFDINTINDNDLGGTLNQTLTKTKALMGDLTSQLNQKLADSDAGIDLADVFDKTKGDLTSPTGILSNVGQNAAIQRVLGQLQDEVLTANPTGQLSIPDAQTVKQAVGGMGAWQYDSADPDANAKETVYNAFYRNLKTAIEDNSPDGVKEINQKLSDLIPVVNAVIRRIPVAERNSALSLPDMVGLVGSAINPAALIPTAANIAAHSGVAGSLLSKIGPQITSLAPAAGLSAAGILSPFIGSRATSQ